MKCKPMKIDRWQPPIVHRLLASETLLWGVWIAFCSIISKLKNIYLRWLFRAPGLNLGPGCIVRGSRFISFGRNVYAHGHLWIEAVVFYGAERFHPMIEIGDRVSFSEGVHITCIDRISIGKGALFGSHVYVSDHNHGTYHGAEQSRPEEPPSQRKLGSGGAVQIGNHVWIGDNVVIVGPIKIGEGSIIGANSVVRADVPEFTMVGGIPAKPIRHFEPVTGTWERL